MSRGRPLSPWKMSSGATPDGLGELGVQAQALEVAVERHHVARLDEVQHQLDLLGVAVPGGVHGRVLRGDHVAADVVEPVDRLVHRALVAGDRRGGEDDGVAAAQLDLRMVAVGHPPQRAEGLALGAGGDDHDALVGEVGDLPRPDEHPLGHLDVTERAADRDVLAHRAPDQRDLAIERLRRRRRPAGRGGCSTRSSSRRSAPRSARTLPPGGARRPTPTGRIRGGRRSLSPRTAAAHPRAPARPGARRPRAGRRRASGRTCSRR